MDFEPARYSDEPWPVWYLGRPIIPQRAVVISTVALIVPIGGTLMAPESVEQYQVLVWLLLLVPAFLLAYYRGWRGVAIALALGMVAMVEVQAVLLVRGYSFTDTALLISVTVAYMLIALGIGFLSSRLHEARMKAEELALTDELTGLANRRYLECALQREFAAAKRGRPLVVAFFHLNGLKSLNDNAGHDAGDDALRAVGEVLSTHTRAMNLSGRWSGAEFLSILSSSDLAGALVFVDRVREGLRNAPAKHGAVSICVGVAPFYHTMGSVEDLLVAADQALHRANAGGTDRVELGLPPIVEAAALQVASAASR